MQLQYEHNIYRTPPASTPAPVGHNSEDIAIITVASGDGFRRLLQDNLGAACVIYGGQTMNPSTENFLDAIAALSNRRIILLPNNANIILAAQQAAALTEDREIHVVPTTNIPQAVAAMLVALDRSSDDDAAELAHAMLEEAQHVITGEITTATRHIHHNGLHASEGQYIGLLSAAIVAAGDGLNDVLIGLLQKAGADERELVTLYYGTQVSMQHANEITENLREAFAGVSFTLIDGGQPLYPFVISVE